MYVCGFPVPIARYIDFPSHLCVPTALRAFRDCSIESSPAGAAPEDIAREGPWNIVEAWKPTPEKIGVR